MLQTAFSEVWVCLPIKVLIKHYDLTDLGIKQQINTDIRHIEITDAKSLEINQIREILDFLSKKKAVFKIEEPKSIWNLVIPPEEAMRLINKSPPHDNWLRCKNCYHRLETCMKDNLFPLRVNEKEFPSLLWYTSDTPQALVKLPLTLPKPLPDTKSSRITEKWLIDFQKMLTAIEEAGNKSWVTKRLEKLVTGLRGLKHFCLADATLFVPPLVSVALPLQENLKQKGLAGIFGVSGAGKSKLAIYLAHWWNKTQDGPVYYVENPRMLTPKRCQQLVQTLTNQTYDQTPLLLLEDLHTVQEAATQQRIIKKLIFPLNSRTWAVIGTYTLRPDQHIQKHQSTWVQMFETHGVFCSLEKTWNEWRPYFYPWLKAIARFLERDIPSEWSLKRCTTPWHYLVALGVLRNRFQQLQAAFGRVDELLYGFLAWSYLCTAENGLPLVIVKNQLMKQPEILKLFKQATVIYHTDEIEQKALGDSLKKLELENVYKKWWDTLYVEKIMERWQQPDGENLRLLPSFRSDNHIEFFHNAWAREVLSNLTQETEKYLNKLLAVALPKLKNVFDALQTGESFVDWTSQRVRLSLFYEENEFVVEMLNLSQMGLNSLPENFENLSDLNELYLFNNQLRSLPESFGSLTKLEKLWLDNNQLGALPESFNQLTSLTHLNVAMNQLNSLPESFNQLTSLTHLNVAMNQLNSLPEAINNLTKLKELNLSNNKLDALPDSFGQLSNLKELRLWENRLSSLPKSFGNLINLQRLFLHENQIVSLPESFAQLTKLQILDLASNQLQALPESFNQLSKLEQLWLNDNQIHFLPESFGRLANLRTLNLSWNELQTLPESFGGLGRLETLWLERNRLTSLPESFGNLTTLKWLRLSKNRLTSLPESFGNLSNLKEIILYSNQLGTLPETFGHLTQLAELDLGLNQLQTIPETFGQLTQLVKLDLSWNELQTIPETFGQLTQLTELSLAVNQFTTLPESFDQLTQLIRLNLAGNQLTLQAGALETLQNLQSLNLEENPLEVLPETFGQLTRLVELDLSGNQLRSLPESFGRLSNLKELNLFDNQLKSLPESFFRLSNLQILGLAGNQFKTLPETFGQLTNLRELWLENNQLRSLSKTFGNLTQLERLELKNNQLKALPQTFKNLTNLQTLDLGANQLISLPETFSQLIQLENLNLSYNKLTSLPQTFGNFRRLKRLSLQSNPLSNSEEARINIERLLPDCLIQWQWAPSMDSSSQAVQIGKYDLFIRDSQTKGSPLIFIVPIGALSTLWDPYFKHFSHNYRTIIYALDRQGPPAPKKKESYRYNTFVEHLEQVIEALGVSPPLTLVGVSLGGCVSLDYALKHTEQVHRLVLISSVARSPGFVYKAVKFIPHPIIWRRLKPAIIERISGYLFSSEPDPEDVKELEKVIQETPNAVLYALAKGIILNYNVLDQLQGFSVPTLLLRGKQDIICTEESFNELKQIKHPTAFEIDQAGHALSLERPQEVIEEISKFLKLL